MKLALTFFACLGLCLPLAAGALAEAGPAATSPAVGGPEIKWKAPTNYLSGAAYNVHVELTAPAGGAVVAGWLLTPAAFLASGRALAEREEKGSMSLPEGAKVSVDIDLGPYIKADKDFDLVYASGIGDDRPVSVKLLQPAGAGLNFMDEKSVPLAELKKYNVLLQTNRGDMIVEFWPEVAPNHVRNYLDLAYTNFYSGTTFHRIIPSFMIQGGDPTGSGGGNGPRQLVAEFNDRKHERGVLSMARTDQPNTASCQFFIMHARYPSLDGLYSAFGKLVSGYETLDAIVMSPKGPGDRPLEPQKIVKATVILATAAK